MSRIRWGVLSTGRIAEQFAHDLAFVDNAQLVGATSRTRANAQAFAERHGGIPVFDDYAAMLAAPDIDAVYVATPHTLHAGNTLDAVAAGKAVLCEKPFTTTPAELEPVIDAARQRGTYVMEAMWTWFLPAIRRAKAWIDAGRIGRIVQIKADFGYPQRPYSPDMRVYDARLGGGALLEMGVYPVALLWLLLGRHPERINVMAKFAPNGVEDDLTAILDYGDCTATIGTSFRAKLQNWAYVIGEDAYIAIPDFWRTHECVLFDLDKPVDQFHDGRKSLGLNYETQAVTDDLLAGRTESSIVSLDDSLNIQRLMAAIRAAAEA
ncbi:MAG: Gfo/Idh/MocA family oxidoreductase [Pseudomonadota bacterium]